MTPHMTFWQRWFTLEGYLQARLLRLSNALMWIDSPSDRLVVISEMKRIKTKIRKIHVKRYTR